MPDPDPYTRGYSFSGFQANRPSDPLPANQLDAELDAAATSTAGIASALQDVRRSDGKLQNAIVGLDQLDPDLAARIDGTGEVTVGDLSPTAFANQVEAEGGVASDKIMTPLRTAQALDAQRPFSTGSQATTGTNATSAMTPQRTLQAVNFYRAFASQGEAEEATSTTVVMSPQRTRETLNELRTAFTATAELTFGEIDAGDSATQPVSVTGAEVGDRVVVGLSASGLPAGCLMTAWVSEAGVVTLRITNVSSGALTPSAASDYSVTVLRF